MKQVKQKDCKLFQFYFNLPAHYVTYKLFQIFGSMLNYRQDQQVRFVLALCFRFHPNLILGGTYSGQIVLWDNRVQKRTPIQRTPLSTAAHTVNCFISFTFTFWSCDSSVGIVLGYRLDNWGSRV
jgi:hypothetical protein